VLTALGNSGDPAQIGVVERLVGDDSELVRDAAEWALRRLRAQ
jgi:epoxyqueuosine reductase